MGKMLHLFAGLLYFSSAIAYHQVVSNLPGAYDSDNLTHHVGFLEALPGQRTFYWLVEAEASPDEAPLLVWMNGGPGASSLDGLFAELGPFLLNGRSVPNATSDWQLFRNPHSWHRFANILVWEQPAGVGYSFCVNASSCPHPWNDTTSAFANHHILLAFLNAWPSFRGRDMYIVGESYGGVYVPLVAESLLQHPEFGSDIRLRGIAVGDGCIGYGVPGACGLDTTWALVNFMEGAGAIEADEAAQIRNICGDELKKGGVGPGISEFSGQCRKALKIFAKALGDYNPYRLGSPCGPNEYGNWGSGDAYVCGSQSAIELYFNDNRTRQALGTLGVGPHRWKMWDGDGPEYNITAADTLPAYRALLASGIRVLIYNGLQDPGVNHVNAVEWVEKLGGSTPTRRTWTSGDSHVAGRVTLFESALRYVTIRGAGHLVPADRPREAFAMMSTWVGGKELPEYSGGCQKMWLGRGWADFCEEEDETAILM